MMPERCPHCHALIDLVGIRHRCVPRNTETINEISRSGKKAAKRAKPKAKLPDRDRKKAA